MERRFILEKMAEEVVPSALADLNRITHSLGRYNSNPGVTNTGAQINYAITDKRFYEQIGMTEEEYKAKPTEGIARAAIYQATHLAGEIAYDYFQHFRQEEPYASDEDLMARSIAEGKKYAEEVIGGLKKEETSGAYLASLAATDKRGRLSVQAFGKKIHTPLTAGVDMGSPLKAFLTQAFESSFTFKLLNGFWNQSAVASLIEVNRDKHRYGTEGMLSSAQYRTAGALGMAATFGEMMVAAKIGGFAGAKMAGAGLIAAAGSKAALGSGTYFLLNSALNDTMYRKGTALRYFSNTDIHDKNVGAWLGSRVHDITTYWATMAITGPRQTLALSKKFLEYRPDTFSKALWYAAHPIVNTVTDSLLDTTIDFGSFLAADTLIGADYFTQESQRIYGLNKEELFSVENLSKFGNMWYRRATMRLANQMVAKPAMKAVGDVITGKRADARTSYYESKEWWSNYFDYYWDGSKKLKNFVSKVGAMSYRNAPQNLSMMQKIYDEDKKYRPMKLSNKPFAHALADGDIDSLMFMDLFYQTERNVNAIFDLSVKHDLVSLDSRVLNWMNFRTKDVGLPLGGRILVTQENAGEVARQAVPVLEQFLRREFDEYVAKEIDLTSDEKNRIWERLEAKKGVFTAAEHTEEALFYEGDRGRMINRAIAEIEDNAAKRATAFLEETFAYDETKPLPILNELVNKSYGGKISKTVKEVQSGKVNREQLKIDDTILKAKISLISSIDEATGGKLLRGKDDTFKFQVFGVSSRAELDSRLNLYEMLDEFYKFIEDLPEDMRHHYVAAGYFQRTREGGLEHTGYVKALMQNWKAFVDSGDDIINPDARTSMLNIITLTDEMSQFSAKRVIEGFQSAKQIISSGASDISKGEQLSELYLQMNHQMHLFGHRYSLNLRNQVKQEEIAYRKGRYGDKTYEQQANEYLNTYYEARQYTHGHELTKYSELEANELKRYQVQKILLYDKSKDLTALMEVLENIVPEDMRGLLKDNEIYYNTLLAALGKIEHFPPGLKIRATVDGEETELSVYDLALATYNTSSDELVSTAGLLAYKAFAIAFHKKYMTEYETLNRLASRGYRSLSFEEKETYAKLRRSIKEGVDITSDDFFEAMERDVASTLMGDSEDKNITFNVSKDGEDIVIGVKVEDSNALFTAPTYILKSDHVPTMLQRQFYDKQDRTTMAEKFLVMGSKGSQFMNYKELENTLKDKDPNFMDRISWLTNMSSAVSTALKSSEVNTIKGNIIEFIKDDIQRTATNLYMNEEHLDAFANRILFEANKNDARAQLQISKGIKGITTPNALNVPGALHVSIFKDVERDDLSRDQIITEIEKKYPGYTVVNIGSDKAKLRENYFALPFSLKDYGEDNIRKVRQGLKQFVNSGLDTSLLEHYLSSETPTTIHDVQRYDGFVSLADKRHALKEDIYARIDQNINNAEEMGKMFHDVITMLNTNKLDTLSDLKAHYDKTIKQLAAKHNLPSPIDQDGKLNVDKLMRLAYDGKPVKEYVKVTSKIREAMFDNEAEGLRGMLGYVVSMLETPEAQKYFAASDKGGHALQTLKDFVDLAYKGSGVQFKGKTIADYTKAIKEELPKIIKEGKGFVGKAEEFHNFIAHTREMMHGISRVTSVQKTEMLQQMEDLMTQYATAIYKAQYEYLDKNLRNKMAIDDRIENFIEDYRNLVIMRELIVKSEGSTVLSDAIQRAKDKPAESISYMQQMLIQFSATQGRSLYDGHLKRFASSSTVGPDPIDMYDKLLASLGKSNKKSYKIILADVATAMNTDPYDGHWFAGRFIIDAIRDSFLGDKLTGGMAPTKAHLIPFGPIDEKGSMNARFKGIPEADLVITTSTLKAIDPILLEFFRGENQSQEFTPKQVAFLLSNYFRHVEQRASIDKREHHTSYSFLDPFSNFLANELVDTEMIKINTAGQANYGESLVIPQKELAVALNLAYKENSIYNMIASLSDAPDYALSTRMPGRDKFLGSRQEIDVSLTNVIELLSKKRESLNIFKNEIDKDPELKRLYGQFKGANKFEQFIHAAAFQNRYLDRQTFIKLSEAAKKTMIHKDVGIIAEFTTNAGEKIYIGQQYRHGTEHQSHFLPVVVRGFKHPDHGDQTGANEIWKIGNNADFDGDQGEFVPFNKEKFVKAIQKHRQFNVNNYVLDKNHDLYYSDERVLRDMYNYEAKIMVNFIDSTSLPIAAYPDEATLPMLFDDRAAIIGPLATKTIYEVLRSSSYDVFKEIPMQHSAAISRDFIKLVSEDKLPTETTEERLTVLPPGDEFVQSPVTQDKDVIVMKLKDGKLVNQAKILGASHSIPHLPLQSSLHVIDGNKVEFKYFFLAQEVSEYVTPELTPGHLVLGYKDVSESKLGYSMAYISRDPLTREALQDQLKQLNDALRDPSLAMRIRGRQDKQFNTSKDMEKSLSFFRLKDPDTRIITHAGYVREFYNTIYEDGRAIKLMQDLGKGYDTLENDLYEIGVKMEFARNTNWQFNYNELSESIETFSRDMVTKYSENSLFRKETIEKTTDEVRSYLRRGFTGSALIERWYQAHADDKNTSTHGKQFVDLIRRMLRGEIIPDEKLDLLDTEEARKFLNDKAHKSMDIKVIQAFVNMPWENTHEFAFWTRYADISQQEIVDYLRPLMKSKGILRTPKSEDIRRMANVVQNAVNTLSRIDTFYMQHLLDGTRKDSFAIIPLEHLKRFDKTTKTEQQKLVNLIQSLIMSDDKTKMAGISGKKINEFLNKVGIFVQEESPDRILHVKSLDHQSAMYLPFEFREGATTSYMVQQQKGFLLVDEKNNPLSQREMYNRISKRMDELYKLSFQQRWNADELERERVIATALFNYTDMQTTYFMHLAALGLHDKDLRKMLLDTKEKYVAWGPSSANLNAHFRIKDPTIFHRLMDHYRYDRIYNTELDWALNPILKTGNLANCI